MYNVVVLYSYIYIVLKDSQVAEMTQKHQRSIRILWSWDFNPGDWYSLWLAVLKNPGSNDCLMREAYTKQEKIWHGYTVIHVLFFWWGENIYSTKYKRRTYILGNGVLLKGKPSIVHYIYIYDQTWVNSTCLPCLPLIGYAWSYPMMSPDTTSEN